MRLAAELLSRCRRWRWTRESVSRRPPSICKAVAYPFIIAAAAALAAADLHWSFGRALSTPSARVFYLFTQQLLWCVTLYALRNAAAIECNERRAITREMWRGAVSHVTWSARRRLTVSLSCRPSPSRLVECNEWMFKCNSVQLDSFKSTRTWFSNNITNSFKLTW